MTISLQYIYSACVKTYTPDLSILHDPWFTDGAYDGSWFQWPKVDNPVSACGDCDYIYISHIHPDHYDPIFLKKYMVHYGEKTLIISDHKPNILANKLTNDGFKFKIVSANSPLHVGATSVIILPHIVAGSNNIDSALILEYRDSSFVLNTLVNLNDCIYDPKFYSSIIDLLASGTDILLTTYTGAGPYPQCFFDIDDKCLKLESQNKAFQFKTRFLDTVDIFNPKYVLPFAGQYILGGDLAKLNEFRGSYDPIELTHDSSIICVLEEGGNNLITSDGIINGTRVDSYNLVEQDLYAHSCTVNSRFDQILPTIHTDLQEAIPRLLNKALKSAYARTDVNHNWWYIIKISESLWIGFCVKSLPTVYLHTLDALSQFKSNHNYIQLKVSLNYLFLLLTSVLHWNNAVIGSWITYERHPNEYHADVQSFLNHLYV